MPQATQCFHFLGNPFVRNRAHKHVPTQGKAIPWPASFLTLAGGISSGIFMVVGEWPCSNIISRGVIIRFRPMWTCIVDEHIVWLLFFPVHALRHGFWLTSTMVVLVYFLILLSVLFTPWVFSKATKLRMVLTRSFFSIPHSSQVLKSKGLKSGVTWSLSLHSTACFFQAWPNEGSRACFRFWPCKSENPKVVPKFRDLFHILVHMFFKSFS